jgi:3-phosphoshikimate 1-carboxyvinyltransferase
MNIKLSHPTATLIGDLKVTGSKSESNRALILQALYPSISIENLSNSDDTKVLREALNSTADVVDIHHAGTAMRFLTAYLATIPEKEVVLTGSERMQERPIKLLVDALQDLGAEISYLNKEGFPPLKIHGKKLLETSVSVKANISSQYISALMLIGASLPDGIEINLDGPMTSLPYIEMTLELLQYIGIGATMEAQKIMVQPAKTIEEKVLHIESDWSSASYFYSLAALSRGARIKLSNYRRASLQGDAKIAEIYEHFGVTTAYEENSIIIEKKQGKKDQRLILDLQNTPDLAQTIAVTCLGLGIDCELNGLHTLKIKETDRLLALQKEMLKFGAEVFVTEDNLKLVNKGSLNGQVSVDTYNDHRMAMAFAPLSLKIPLHINNAEVVSKSYPEFWDHLKKLQFEVVG